MEGREKLLYDDFLKIRANFMEWVDLHPNQPTTSSSYARDMILDMVVLCTEIMLTRGESLEAIEEKIQELLVWLEDDPPTPPTCSLRAPITEPVSLFCV